jgi:hypothetical protein
MNRSGFEFRTIVIMSAFVSLCAVRMSAVEIVNSGFETPAFPPTGWLKISAEPDPTDGLVGGWTFFNNSGIGNNGSPWVDTAPEGVQVGYVKDNSSIEQDFEITSLGSYRLDFLAAHRPNHPATHLRVLIDDLEVAYWASSEIMDNEQFATYSVYLGFLPQGTHTLTFEGIKPGADSATAFDDVRIEIEVEACYWNPAPLSSNWNATVWSMINGDPGTLSWVPGSIAVFNQPSAYTVSIDTSQSAETLYVDAGDVTFDGVATVSFADMFIASGATLSGAGERYLKVGDTQLILDGTLEVSSLTDPGRTLELVSGTGSLVLAANIAVSGKPYFSGSVSGSGGLTKIGADELRVDNSFTGAATVESGFLVLKNALAGSVSVAADAGVAFETPAALVAALNDSGNNFADGSMAGLYNAAALVSPDLSAADFGSVKFLKLGAGTLEINNATALSEATNGVVIAGGNFLYKNASAIPGGSPITVRNGAILSFNYSALMTIDHPLTLSGNYDETDSKGSLFMQWGDSTVDINAPITLADDTKIQAYASQETVNFNAPIIGTGNLIIEGDGAANDHLKIFNFNVPFTYEGNTILRNEGGSSAEFYWGTDNIMPTNYVLRVSGQNGSFGDMLSQIHPVGNRIYGGDSEREEQATLTHRSVGYSVRSGYQCFQRVASFSSHTAAF